MLTDDEVIIITTLFIIGTLSLVTTCLILFE
jgi:hypothetical protein